MPRSLLKSSLALAAACALWAGGAQARVPLLGRRIGRRDAGMTARGDRIPEPARHTEIDELHRVVELAQREVHVHRARDGIEVSRTGRMLGDARAARFSRLMRRWIITGHF